MEGMEFLNLIIGMFFIYFVLSIICTVVLEIFANALNMRAKNLNGWVRETFNTGQLGDKVLNHRLIDGLTREGRIASYIPAKNFITAVLDIVYSNREGADSKNVDPYTVEQLKAAIATTSLLSEEAKRFILQQITDANDDLDKARKEIEEWYEQSMTRIAGGYKKQAQKYLLVIAAGITLFANADSLTLFRYLYDNPAEAEKITLAAEQAVHDSVLYKQYLQSNANIELLVKKATKDSTVNKDSLAAVIDHQEEIAKGLKTTDSLYKSLKDMGLPLGWETEKYKNCKGEEESSIIWLRNGENWLMKIAGLIITALALTLGAPFWFEQLNKLVNMRTSGIKPEQVTEAKQTEPTSEK